MSNLNQPQNNEADQLWGQPELLRISPEVSEAIKGLDAEKRAVIIQAVKQELFSGPIPHPELLKGYEDVKQGFAERIVAMAEEQQKHRFECERNMVNGTISESKRGQWMAFAIAILFLIASVALGLYGHDWLAGVIGGGTLVALVTVFITNRPSKKHTDTSPKQE